MALITPTVSQADLDSETASKVLQLTIELIETRQQKKAAVGGYNDEIKRIEKEIQELVTDSVDAEEDT